MNLRRSIFRTTTLAGILIGPIRSAMSKARISNQSVSDPAPEVGKKSGDTPVFLFCDVTVKNRARLEDYIKASAGTLAPYGGRFHVQAGKVHVIEGNWTPSVVIIAQFPSLNHARRWYQSPEYAGALAIKPLAIDRNMIMCEGLA